MIEPHHSGWAETVFVRYLRWLLRRRFHGVRLLGPLPVLRNDAPVLLLPNHGTWWDGFFVHLLNRLLLQRSLYVMMLSDQLKRYPFFRRLGAYGLDPEDRADVLKTLRYTLDILRNEMDSAVCMFPQGELTPVGKRPLGCKPGAGWLIRKCDRPLNVLPLAMRIDSLGEELPDVSLAFGEPMLVEAEETVSDSELEAALEATLDWLTSAVHENGPSLEPVRELVTGTSSISERVLTLRRLLRPGGEPLS